MVNGWWMDGGWMVDGWWMDGMVGMSEMIIF